MLDLVTWNVDGLNESRLGQRMERLCLEILVGGDLKAALAGAPTPPMPHVVALQEVVHVAYRGYFAPHFAAAGYRLWPTRAPAESEYWELLAVRPPWTLVHAERRPFAHSPLGRAGTVAELVHGASGARATVITGHLESLRSGAEARVDQAREIAGWLREADGPAVFAGDTNLREREARTLAEPPRDAFVEAGSPATERDTWHPDAEEGGPGFRFDRVWLAGPIHVRRLRLRRSRASDHHGVEVRLAIDD
ncbi:MAG TPA: endonuclease/exonuclease/phosphatase family protein [Sandaracinaceae bacterium LLY-WYZ-13_1]|nr:endonuclease/exonuclease/phosphatase family protein [Sandaracinaceae bacterium LLY-WYZ-13_1]